MLYGVIGVVLIFWGLAAGLGTRENNRAKIFQGPVGTLVNFIVIGAGASLIISAF